MMQIQVKLGGKGTNIRMQSKTVLLIALVTHVENMKGALDIA